jgi:tryptophan synthase alpha chain
VTRLHHALYTTESVKRCGFIPFVTAGDPDLVTSLAIVRKLAELGADVIELGVPFSDPMADGPTIQRSSQRALAKAITLQNVIEIAADVRKGSQVPIVLFSYFNPILRFGIDEFAAAVSKAGVDGVLLTDVVDDEAAELAGRFANQSVDLISLVAPTTTDERLRHICDNARGFIYAVSRAGVTGARENSSAEAEKLVLRAREFTDMPIAVGFGISTREQVADVWRYADAAVIGSAIVAEIERADSRDAAISRVGSFVSDLLPKFAKNGAEI